MRIQKYFTLLAATILPLLTGLSQTTKPPAASPASVSSDLLPGGAEAVGLAQTSMGDDVALAFIRQSQANYILAAGYVKAVSHRGGLSLVVPASPDWDTALSTTELFAFNATNRDERDVRRLDLNADGAVGETQHFDTDAAGKQHFSALNENEVRQFRLTELLTQALKHCTLYNLFTERDESKVGGFSWGKEVVPQKGLRLFSIDF